MLDDAIERVLIDADTIAVKVKHMAAQISATYQGVDELILVCILNGAFRFTADLEQHLSAPYNIDFMSLSSYPTTDTKYRSVETRGRSTAESALSDQRGSLKHLT